MTLKLKDAALLRQQCYVDGEWRDADEGGKHEVKNPATGEALGTVPLFSAAETRRAIDAARAAFPAWAARTAKDRASLLRRWHDLMLANVDDLATLMTAEQGKPLGGVEGRDRLCGVIHRVVRRGRQAPVRRRHPRTPARQAHRRPATAGGRRRRDHAVEFPRRDDHPQGRSGARRRLHLRLQAGDPDAVLGARAWPSSRTAPAFHAACSTS